VKSSSSASPVLEQVRARSSVADRMHRWPIVGLPCGGVHPGETIYASGAAASREKSSMLDGRGHQAGLVMWGQQDGYRTCSAGWQYPVFAAISCKHSTRGQTGIVVF
jgi:hypothetical protein